MHKNNKNNPTVHLGFDNRVKLALVSLYGHVIVRKKEKQMYLTDSQQDQLDELKDDILKEFKEIGRAHV